MHLFGVEGKRRREVVKSTSEMEDFMSSIWKINNYSNYYFFQWHDDAVIREHLAAELTGSFKMFHFLEYKHKT